MNNNEPVARMRMVTPSVLLCIGQSLMVFAMFFPLFFCALDRYEDETFGPIACIATMAAAVLCIIGSSIMIARFHGARVSVAGPVTLLVGSVIAFFANCIIVVNICENYNGDDDVRALGLIAALILGGIMIAATIATLRSLKAFYFVKVTWIIYAAVLVVWSISAILIDSGWRYDNYWHESFIRNKDGIVTAGIIVSILVLGISVLMLVSWVKVVKYFQVNRPETVTVSQSTAYVPRHTASAQSAANYQASGSPYSQTPNHSPYMSQQQVTDHSAYMPQQEVAARSAQTSAPAGQAPVDPRMAEWAKSLTPEQLKYVILNPSAYGKEAVDACALEIAKRI